MQNLSDIVARPLHRDNVLTPSLRKGDCVTMERLRGEAVGFQSFRTRVF